MTDIDMTAPPPERQRRLKGSITERDGNLVVRVFVGRDAGKRVTWYETVQGTDKRAHTDARAALKRLLARKDAARSPAIQQSRASLGEWATEFLNVWSGDRSERTKNGLRYCFTHFVPADLRATPLRALTDVQLQAWVSGMTDAEQRAPLDALSARTARKALADVRVCLQEAVKRKRIAFNAASDVTPPKQAHAEKGRFTVEQAKAFLDAAVGDDLYLYYLLAVKAGARPSELLALRWSDIEDAHLVIQRAMVDGADRTRVVGDTKTCVVRRIPLAADVREAITRHRRAQAERRLRLGPAYRDEGYLFTTDTGVPFAVTSSPNRHFHRIRAAAGLPAIKPYNLRHSCASLLADEGVPLMEIKAWLGHKDVKTTLGYIVARPDAQARTAAVMDRVLAR